MNKKTCSRSQLNKEGKMPKVGNKTYAYTKKGKAAAAKAREKAKAKAKKKKGKY